MHLDTLIVPFEVSKEQIAVLHSQWQQLLQIWSKQPHFHSAKLYEVDETVEASLIQNLGLHWLQNRPEGQARFRLIALIHWQSMQPEEATMHITQIQEQIRFPAYPAFYTNEHSGNVVNLPHKTFALVVPFEVSKDQGNLFLQQWQAIVDGADEMEGSLGPGLYERSFRQLSVTNTSFPFINVAEWASLSHYEHAIRSIRQKSPISFPSHGGYYHIIDVYP